MRPSRTSRAAKPFPARAILTRLIAEAGYNGERIVLLDAADIPQLHAEALVTNDLLQKLGLNVELATTEWGTVVKRVQMREPIEQGGWNVFVTAFASFDMINPATNRFLRAGGVKGAHPAGRRTKRSRPCGRPGSPQRTRPGGVISPIRSSSGRSNSCPTFLLGSSSADGHFARTSLACSMRRSRSYGTSKSASAQAHSGSAAISTSTASAIVLSRQTLIRVLSTRRAGTAD